MTRKKNYYNIPADKIGFVLSHLEACGWEFFEVPHKRYPISKFYGSATSRNWDGHKPVFVMEEHSDYRDLSITSDLLMEANKDTSIIKSYDEFKQDYLRHF